MAEQSTPRPFMGLIQLGVMLFIVLLLLAIMAEFLPVSRSQAEPTPTVTGTPTATPSPTTTNTPRPAIQIEAPTPTDTPATTDTPTPSPTPTWTPVPTDTPTATPLPTRTPTNTPTPTPHPLGEPALVLDVLDGNTIEVFLDGQRRIVRYVYIVTPVEGQPLYEEALAANLALVTDRTVYLSRAVSDIDSAGRLLRYVRLEGDVLVNAELARLGLAQVDESQPGVQLAGDIWLAQAEAKRARIGLWSGQRFLPYANAAAPLYTKPDLTAPVAGAVAAGETLTLKYRDPTAQWYQLDNDLWIASQLVTNVARVPDLAPGFFRFAVLVSPDPAFVPFAITDATLHTGPGFQFPVAGRVFIGQPLNIIDRDPTGAWYLLDNGLWICNLFVETGYVDTTLSEQARFVSEIRPFVADLVQGWDRLFDLFFQPDIYADAWDALVLEEIAGLQVAYGTLLNVRPPAGLATLYDELAATSTECKGWTDAIDQSLNRFNEADIKFTATLMASCRDNLVTIMGKMEAAVAGVPLLAPQVEVVQKIQAVLTVPDGVTAELLVPASTGVDAAGVSTVLIQRIVQRGVARRAESDEYVVIANVSSLPQQLRGWRLTAGDAGQDFIFPTLELEPGDTCRIYTNEIHLGSCGLSFKSSVPLWHNDAGCGFLFDATDTLVSEFCYD